MLWATDGHFWGWKSSKESQRTVVLQEWILDQQPQLHGGAYEKDRILGSHLRSTDSEFLGMGLINLCLISSLGDSDAL